MFKKKHSASPYRELGYSSACVDDWIDRRPRWRIPTEASAKHRQGLDCSSHPAFIIGRERREATIVI